MMIIIRENIIVGRKKNTTDKSGLDALLASLSLLVLW
jgi:hypothetical protein